MLSDLDAHRQPHPHQCIKIHTGSSGVGVRRGRQPGGERARCSAGVLGLGDRPDDDRTPRAASDHVVQALDRLDAADREPRPAVLARRGVLDQS